MFVMRSSLLRLCHGRKKYPDCPQIKNQSYFFSNRPITILNYSTTRNGSYSIATRTLTLENTNVLAQTKLPYFHETISQRPRPVSFWGSNKATDWNKAVMEAERIVGYSTSFLSLRCLLSDELSNVAMHMRKLVGTGHPLLKTARKLFYDGKQSLQTRGLLVLLTSKAAGPSPDSKKINEVMISGIYPRQRTLAEITEMIHTAGLIHKGVVNLAALGPLDGALGDMEFGNKMAVLSGDFLLANASTGLASLNNTQVVEMISNAIGDIMKAEFTQLRDSDGSCVLPPGGATIDEWERQTFLSSGSLIAHSCSAALSLAEHPKRLRDAAFEFGKQIAFAHQINEELQPIIASPEEDDCKLSVTSLPILLYTQTRQNEPLAQTILAGRHVESTKLLKSLTKSSSSVQEAKRLRGEYGKKAIAALNDFSKSTAQNALENMVTAITRI